MICAVFAAVVAPRPAAAWACYGDMANEDGPWTERLLQDSRAAGQALEREIAAPSDPALSAAHRLALLGDAQGELGDFAAAARTVEAARAALAPTDSRALRDRIEMHRIMLVEARGDAPQAVAQLEKYLPTIPAEAPHRLCALIDRGYLRFRTGEAAAAIEDLIQAHELANAAGRTRWRIYAGNILGAVYSVIGLHEDAWRFGDEAVRHYQAGDRPVELGDAYFRRGNASLNAGDLRAAESDFRLAETLLSAVGTESRLLFVHDRLCQLFVLAQRPLEAQPACERARAGARTLGMLDIENLEVGRLGEIQVQRGRYASALPLLDRALDARVSAVSERLRSPLHMARARARAELGDWRGAHDDAQQRVRLLEQEARSGDAARLAVLNSRFQTQRREAELQRRQAQLERAQVEAAYEKARVAAAVRSRNLVIAGSILVLLGISAATLAWRGRTRADSARKATEARLESLVRLSGGVAHEFNNLMTIVQQATGLLRRRREIETIPGATDLLQDISAASESGALITAQMLSFAQQQRVSPEPIDLQPWLAANQPLLSHLVGEQLQVSIDVAPPCPRVLCDRRQLTAALMNLVANARDVSDAGATVRIRARAHSPGFVQLSVSDDGVGMSAEVLAHAAEPFFSTKEVGRGAGLGLSMVDGFSRQSGGRMEIRSAPGAGTTVTLLLPAISTASTPVEARPD